MLLVILGDCDLQEVAGRRALVEGDAGCSELCPFLSILSKVSCESEGFPAPEVRVIEAYGPFEEVSVDFITKWPKDEAGSVNILVVVDNITKFVG
jgi:hypothetical protein